MKIPFPPYPTWIPILATLGHCTAQAGLVDPKGLWQLDGDFTAPVGSALATSTLAAATDYSFATDPAGYHFLQTQVWAPPNVSPFPIRPAITAVAAPPAPINGR